MSNKKKSKTVLSIVSQEEYEAIARAAAEEDRSISYFIRRAVLNDIKSREQRNKKD